MNADAAQGVLARAAAALEGIALAGFAAMAAFLYTGLRRQSPDRDALLEAANPVYAASELALLAGLAALLAWAIVGYARRRAPAYRAAGLGWALFLAALAAFVVALRQYVRLD